MTAVAMSFGVGCHGYLDPATIQPEKPNTPNPPVEEIIPVGELRLSADKTSIEADGAQKDGFSRTRFTGENTQALKKIYIKFFNYRSNPIIEGICKTLEIAVDG